MAEAALRGSQSARVAVIDGQAAGNRRRCCWRNRVGWESAARMRATFIIIGRRLYTSNRIWDIDVGVGESDGSVSLLTSTFLLL